MIHLDSIAMIHLEQYWCYLQGLNFDADRVIDIAERSCLNGCSLTLLTPCLRTISWTFNLSDLLMCCRKHDSALPASKLVSFSGDVIAILE